MRRAPRLRPAPTPQPRPSKLRSPRLWSPHPRSARLRSALLISALLGAAPTTGPALAQSTPRTTTSTVIQTSTPVPVTPLTRSGSSIPGTNTPAINSVTTPSGKTTTTPISITPGLSVPNAATPLVGPLNGAVSGTYTLAQALAALNGGLSYRQALLTLAAAQANYDAAVAGTAVTVGVGGTVSEVGADAYTSASGAAVAAADSSASSVSVTASLPVLPWSTANLNVQIAARALAVARVTFAQTVSALRVTLYGNYASAAQATLTVQVASRSLALAQLQLAAAQVQAANNNATAAGVQTYQAAVLDAQTTLARSQSQLDLSRRALGVLLGLDLSRAAVETDSAATLTLPTLDAAVQAARAFSPALAGALASVQNADANLAVLTRNRRVPLGTLSAAYGPSYNGTRLGGVSASLNLQSGVASASYTQPLTGSATSNGNAYSLGLNASFNVLDPGADAGIRAAQVTLQAAQLLVTVDAQATEQNVRVAYSTALIDEQAVRDRQANVSQTTTALNTARAQLAAGTGTQTAVVNAELAQLQALLNLASARFTALSSAASLASLTGL